MFNYASTFNQAVNSWNVAGVTEMDKMFNRAHKFNQPLNDWIVGSVLEMSKMFNRATSFNQCLDDWADQTPNNVDTSSMLKLTACPNNIESPDPSQGPWCQSQSEGCFA